MSVAKLTKSNRREELKAICRFIETCDLEDLVRIIEEIRCVHDNLIAWNEDTHLLAKVESTSINSEFIQLNITKDLNENNS
jgi:hypothetical protein